MGHTRRERDEVGSKMVWQGRMRRKKGWSNIKEGKEGELRGEYTVRMRQEGRKGDDI